MSLKKLLPFVWIVMSGVAFADEPAKKPMHHAPSGRDAMAASHHAAAALPASALRDWGSVDVNHDNLVSPEEMERYLADNPGPLKKAS